MTKILIDRAVIEKVLDGLKFVHAHPKSFFNVEDEIFSLQEALAEQAEQEPVDLGQIIADKTAQIETYGIEQWTYRPTDAQRYQRLRILGAAPTGSDNLQRGTVLCFQSLDEFIDNDIRVNPSRGEAGPMQQSEQEPVGYWQGTFNTEGGAILYEVPQVSAFGYCYPNHPVYAYPVRTKDLTDDEIVYLWNMATSDFDFARAVIAAYKEKNK